jgi:hypothetical protein
MLAFLNMAHAQVSLPYSEGFENGLNGWTLTDCQSDTGLTNSNNFVHSGDSAFTFHWTTSPPQYLISPEFTGTNNHELNVSFYYKSGSTGSFSETFQVGYSTNSNDISDFTFGEEITANPGNDWELYTEAFPSGTKYVAIKCTSNDALYLCIDDFVFTKGDELVEAELTVHDGSSTSNFVPVYGTWCDAYLKCEMVYPATELNAMAGGKINGLTYYLSYHAAAVWDGTFQVFMYEVEDATISDFYGNNGTVLYEGQLDGTGDTMTINFDTPYTYNGGNLLVGIYQIVPGDWKTAYFYGESINGASVQGQSTYGLDYIIANQRNFLPKTTFSYLPYTPILTTLPDTLDLGYRPAGAWMRPYQFTLTAPDSLSVNITDLQLQGIGTDSLSIDLGDLSLPLTLNENESVTLGVNYSNLPTHISGFLTVSYQYGDNTGEDHFFLTGEIYEPAAGDVWETAKLVDSLPYNDTLTVNSIPLYDNYVLPNPNIPDGNDVVYKLEFDQDILLNASVTGDNGKVFLYEEGFQGVGGPDEDNYCQTNLPFEAQIGDETTATGSLPMYNLYNNSLSCQLFLADELREAGVNTTPMSSISWFTESTYGFTIKNVSIWMANVNDNTVSASSPLGSSMTLVFQGDFQQVVGWNEFGFNQEVFAWDGSSNLLVMVQMNNGTWNPAIQWHYHTPGFQSSAYQYRDDPAFDAATTSYSMITTSIMRANTLFKVGLQDNHIDNFFITPGTYYLVASSTSDEFTVSINTEAPPCPDPASNPTPANNAQYVNEVNTELSWELADYTTQYCLCFGTDPNSMDTIVPWTRELGSQYLFLDTLNRNTTYYWQVGERNDGCPDGVFSGPWSFTTPLDIPQNLTAADATVFNDEQIVLSWNAINDNALLYYNVYRDGGVIGTTTYTTYTDGPLAYNMGGYPYYVTAVYSAGESAPSNTVTVQVSGRGYVNGHVFDEDGENGINNATVTFEGQDEFGVNHTYIFNTNAQGYYSGQVYAGSYSGSAACHGYQDSNAPAQGNPVPVGYNQTTASIDYLLEKNQYHITATADPENYGEISGAGDYPYHNTCTLVATNNIGYHFVNWTVNDSVVSTSNTLNVYVTQDSIFVAHFELNSYEIEASADPTTGGEITGTGTYHHFDDCTLIATPLTGYHFVNWTVNDTEVSTSDTLTFTVTQDSTFVAHFNLNSYDIEASADPTAGGEITGTGTYHHFESCTLTATPKDHYVFLNWTEDDIVVSNEPVLTFEVLGARSLVANFMLKTYTVTVGSVPVEGGTVTGGNVYAEGETANLNAIPNDGFVFRCWNRYGISVCEDASYSFTVTEDVTLLAHFDTIWKNVDVTIVPPQAGTVEGGGRYMEGATATLQAYENQGYAFNSWVIDGITYDDNPINIEVNNDIEIVANFDILGYVVTVGADPDEGGSVSGGGEFDYGQTATVNAEANEGYTFVNWTINGEQVSTEMEYSFTVTETVNLMAHFTLNNYLVTVNADPAEGGTVMGSSGYDYGQTATVNANANTGYTFVNWTLNGQQVSTENEYSFTVTESVTLVAHFSINSYEVIVNAEPSEGGNVSGDGEYEYGQTATVNANANTGYTFVNWTLNGEQVSTETEYSFTVTETENGRAPCRHSE